MPVLPPTDLDEVDTPPQNRCRKSRKVANDTATEGDDAVAPFDAGGQQPIAEFGQMLIALGGLARRHDDRGGPDAMCGQGALERGEMGRSDI